MSRGDAGNGGGPRVVVLPDVARFADAAAGEVTGIVERAVERRGAAHVALAGGSTPRPVYHRLTEEPWRDALPWPEVEWFWSDERCVPPDDPRSNYHLAREALLAPAPVPEGRVHRVHGELPPAQAVAAYEAEIASVLGTVPLFDLVLLGMGEDGHTASLFPDLFAGGVTDPHPGVVVAATEAPVEPRQRVTFTLSCLNAALHVLVLVRGAGKAEMAARVLAALRSGETEDVPPAARVRPLNGELTWMLDAAAAAELPPELRGEDG